jgi:putative tricarboxylic transport membrane protein
MNLQRAHRIAGLLLLLLAGYIVHGSLQLTYFTSLGPGPGFFPFWLAIILGGLAIVMLVRTFVGQPEATPPDFVTDRAGYLRIGMVILALAATALAFERLGFRVTMLAMYLLLLGTLGRHRLVGIALIALAGSFGVYYLFVHWLHVPLPVGVFGL